MPELPEVETVKRGLSRVIDFNSTTIVNVELSDKPLRVFPDKKLLLKLSGQKIRLIVRKAKYLLFHLDDWVLLSHLGMTGSWRMAKDQQKHDHIKIYLSDGRVLTYQDPRRFGMFDILNIKNWEESPMLTKLGLDPVLDSTFRAENLLQIFKKSHVPIKVSLMNQKYIVGVGNIYASEALYLAGIHPLRASCSLLIEEWRLLIEAVRHVLFEAIFLGGSTIQSYKNSSGESGGHQSLHFVYGKSGLPCVYCKKTIENQAIVGRNSFWCSSCQEM